jgi:GxxExxY protein
LKVEFEIQNIPYVYEPSIQLDYKDRVLDQYFKPDFVCYEKIIVELKAVADLNDEHRAQIMNYLNAAKFDLGLLVNFGHYPKLEYERFGNRKDYKSLKAEIKSWK